MRLDSGLTATSEWSERAKRVLAREVSPLYQGPVHYRFADSPLYAETMTGGYVVDVDGRRYIDLVMGHGPVILGHAHPVVAQAVRRQTSKGTLSALMHVLEIEVAEILTRLIPCCERVAFGKNGSDACTAAVRLARAITGRSLVMYSGVHGFHDWFAATIPGIRGLPRGLDEQTLSFEYNKAESL